MLGSEVVASLAGRNVHYSCELRYVVLQRLAAFSRQYAWLDVTPVQRMERGSTPWSQRSPCGSTTTSSKTNRKPKIDHPTKGSPILTHLGTIANSPSPQAPRLATHEKRCYTAKGKLT